MKISKRAIFEKARLHFESLTPIQQHAFRTEFPPMDEDFADKYDMRREAELYNEGRRILDVADAKRVETLRVLKAHIEEVVKS